MPKKNNSHSSIDGQQGIVIDSLSVIAGGKKLLDKTSAEFKAGEISLVVGPSGVGKSILLRIVAGLIETSNESIKHKGKISVDGLRAKSGRTGVVFQSFALFDEMSPTKNVEFAKAGGGSSASKTSPEEWLDELGVPKKVPTSRLSGGQRQRLAIARTLAYNPPAIVYDEPTSGLDPTTGKHVAGLIKQTHEQYGKTSVIVTHDYESLLPIADKVFLLNPQTKKLEHLPKEQWSNIADRLAGMSKPLIEDSEILEKPSVQTDVANWLFGFLQGTTNAVIAVFAGLLSLLPMWKSPKWGLRFFGHYSGLVFGPTAWIYLIMSGIISGFVVTYFTFKFLPYATYIEPLLIEDLLTALGFSMYRIFVPVLACVLIAARCGAAVASDVGGRQFGNQIDALKTFDASPRRYLLTPILWAFCIGTPLLNFVSYYAARMTSLFAFVHSHPDRGPDFWEYHFHKGMNVLGESWYRGTGWLMAKLLICGFGVALISYHIGRKPKYSTTDVSRGVTSTILYATLFALLVHFVFSFFEYEGLVPGGK